MLDVHDCNNKHKGRQWTDLIPVLLLEDQSSGGVRLGEERASGASVRQMLS